MTADQVVGTRATLDADKEIEELTRRNRELEQQIDIIKYVSFIYKTVITIIVYYSVSVALNRTGGGVVMFGVQAAAGFTSGRCSGGHEHQEPLPGGETSLSGKPAG